MVSPAASWPRTALTVTRVSRIHGRPLIRCGSMVIRSYATSSGYAPRPPDIRHRAVFTDSPVELIQAERQHKDHAIVELVFADVTSGPLAHLPSCLRHERD